MLVHLLVCAACQVVQGGVSRQGLKVGMKIAYRETLTLNNVYALSKHIQQQVADTVIEQVELVNVQNPTVGLGQQAADGQGLWFYCLALSTSSTETLRL